MSDESSGRTCVFCGSGGKMTGEHVWPKWTRKVVLPDGADPGAHIFHPGGERKVVHGLPYASIEVKRVCGPCNEGWLHDLEERARPLLTRPIQGNPATFRGNDLKIVATWAYKTCILCDLASTQLLGPRGFQWLYEHREPPESVGIYFASYGGNRFPLIGLSRPANFKVTINDEPPGGTEVQAYLLTVGVGHLVFQVFGHHIEGMIAITPTDWKRDASRVIWPQPESARWPPPVHLDDTTYHRFAGIDPPDER